MGVTCNVSTFAGTQGLAVPLILSQYGSCQQVGTFPVFLSAGGCPTGPVSQITSTLVQVLDLSQSSHPSQGLVAGLSLYPRGSHDHCPRDCTAAQAFVSMSGLPIPAFNGLGWGLISSSSRVHSLPSNPVGACPTQEKSPVQAPEGHSRIDKPCKYYY